MPADPAVLASTSSKKKRKKKPPQRSYGGCKLAQFRHKDEGYALEWSPQSFGRLAAGTCDS